MNRLNLCLKISAENFDSFESSNLEKDYQQYFKEILSFLYENPRFPVSISFSGMQLDYYQKKHPEAIRILSELVSRRQLEILGGSFYLCIFPLLLSADRYSQIEMLTTAVRSKFGRRPRGICLFGDIWDPALIMNFQSCGFDFLLLDKNLIPFKNKKFSPVITTYLGKSIKVIPSYEYNPDFYGKNLDEFVKNYEKDSDFDFDDNSVFTINFSLPEFFDFIHSETAKEILFQQSYLRPKDSAFIELPLSALTEKNSIELELFTCQNFLKKAFHFENLYIPAAMNYKISRWVKTPFQKTLENAHPLTIYDYLNAYPQNKALFERMMYVSMIISQCKGGDKLRKSAANDCLLKAQCGLSFVNLPDGLPAIAEKRQSAYKFLNEAERLIRDSAKSFKEALTVYDYNNDGLNEYVCQMEKFQGVISLQGGQFTDFNIIKSSSNGNYAANLSRIAEFDKFSDNYRRGILLSRFFEKSQFDSYIKNNFVENDFMPETLYFEKKFESKRKEIYLEGKTKFSALQLPLCVRKNFMLTSNGISMQCILRNEGPIEMSGIFAVEMNFSQICFSKSFDDLYKFELIQDGERNALENIEFCAKKGISLVQLTSLADKVSFILEPNEDSGASFSKISFVRPQSEEKLLETSKTLVVSLFWDITIPPGMEKEKTVNLSIISVKKQN